MRGLIAIVVCWASWAPAHVRADSRQPPATRPGADGVVAVLPLAATNQSMALYSKPVADAIAKRLRERVGLRVEALSLSAAMPTRVDLVVDGRIVTPDAQHVVLEARIRDPQRGRVVTAIATRPRQRTAIDLLARELAERLAPRVTRAFDRQRQRRVAAIAARREAIAAAARRKRETDTPRPVVAPNPKPTAPRNIDSRPVMLVMEVTGREIANDDVVPRAITPAVYRMVKQLGFRPLPGGHRGIVDPLVVRNALRAHGGTYALMIHLPSIAFDWHQVLLSARAKIRVILVGRDGKPRYARTLKTGTIVGSRGDGYAAIVNFIGRQLVDIVKPLLARALGKGAGT